MQKYPVHARTVRSFDSGPLDVCHDMTKEFHADLRMGTEQTDFRIDITTRPEPPGDYIPGPAAAIGPFDTAHRGKSTYSPKALACGQCPS